MADRMIAPRRLEALEIAALAIGLLGAIDAIFGAASSWSRNELNAAILWGDIILWAIAWLSLVMAKRHWRLLAQRLRHDPWGTIDDACPGG